MAKKKATRKARERAKPVARPKRHVRMAGAKSTRSRAPSKKKVAKRAKRANTKPVYRRKPVPSRKPVKRLVRKPARPIQRPPINATRSERASLKHALDVIRKHVKGYEASEGYPLHAVVRFGKSRQRAILQKSATIKELLASPHDLIRPKNDKEKRALRPFARKQLRRAKHYIVHKPDDSSTVSIRRGRVHIKRKQGRVEFDTIYFMFPHAPRGEEDAIEMLEYMLDEMPDGFYIMQTGAHGDTGEPVHKNRLIEQLRNYILAYEPMQSVEVSIDDEETKVMHQGFTQAVMGYRFTSSELDGAIVEANRVDARRQAQREFNERLRKQRMTPTEKFEAKEKWRAKQSRRKRKVASKKAAITRKTRKASPIRVAKKKLRSKKKAASKK